MAHAAHDQDLEGGMTLGICRSASGARCSMSGGLGTASVVAYQPDACTGLQSEDAVLRNCS